jgi:hypothetical protein
VIWDNYVFRRGADVEELWDQMFAERRQLGRPVRLLYVTGRGFDVRATNVLERFVDRLKASDCEIEKAHLLLVGFSGYQLSRELRAQTQKNEAEMLANFEGVGTSHTVIGGAAEGEDDISSNVALRRGADEILKSVTDQTDIVLDVSSLPRVAYVTILLSLLARIIPEGNKNGGLSADGVSLQVLVAEDAQLDSKISSEDPSNDLTLIPGYSEALQSESQQEEPLVWFPILGENRLAQLRKIQASIPEFAEICPILPHPSRNPRRGDELLLEYDSVLFTQRATPISNVFYVNETHPFEVYRQLLGAMQRFRKSLGLIGKCRIVVTPLASKLITVGSALACFEMKLISIDYKSSVAIPYAEPKRYEVDLELVLQSRPIISALLLTGDAYRTDVS